MKTCEKTADLCEIAEESSFCLERVLSVTPLASWAHRNGKLSVSPPLRRVRTKLKREAVSYFDVSAPVVLLSSDPRAGHD